MLRHCCDNLQCCFLAFLVELGGGDSPSSPTQGLKVGSESTTRKFGIFRFLRVPAPKQQRCTQSRIKKLSGNTHLRSEALSRHKKPRGETRPPCSVSNSSNNEGKVIPKPWAASVSLCWPRKQLSGESRSHLHFKARQQLQLTGLQILLGTGSKDCNTQRGATPMGKLLRSPSQFIPSGNEIQGHSPPSRRTPQHWDAVNCVVPRGKGPG